ncbi:hypothetical protein [Niabella drilacis]|uniref:Uncharacterized protein n=1 Tax=Niabella drilacis (strain DSM 25811 / CCM 8410 / CCUG 62505 / LMG 26954 / E90) TaxID=1285928 RepID=A0A1G6V3Z7_NIADE|nr:hypothetical protein [Niabella drilacis]SDD47616.1 hypothetical protein SAMN04487894_109166 [Niabella drilacis]
MRNDLILKHPPAKNRQKRKLKLAFEELEREMAAIGRHEQLMYKGGGSGSSGFDSSGFTIEGFVYYMQQNGFVVTQDSNGNYYSEGYLVMDPVVVYASYGGSGWNGSSGSGYYYYGDSGYNSGTGGDGGGWSYFGAVYTSYFQTYGPTPTNNWAQVQYSMNFDLPANTAVSSDPSDLPSGFHLTNGTIYKDGGDGASIYGITQQLSDGSIRIFIAPSVATSADSVWAMGIIVHESVHAWNFYEYGDVYTDKNQLWQDSEYRAYEAEAQYYEQHNRLGLAAEALNARDEAVDNGANSNSNLEDDPHWKP